MERWEYQVIHLNVEAPAQPARPPAAPPGADPPAGAQPIRVEAVFSKEYLEKEFPGFYGAPPPAGAPAREHPANQLRGFLNLQGRDGWQLLGFYPVGQLTMMIFRRPLQQPDIPDAQAAATQGPGAPAPQAVGSGPAAAGGAAVPAGEAPLDQTDALQVILARLADLERRLPSPPSPPPAEQSGAPQPSPAPASSSPPQGPEQPGDAADLQDGAILPSQRLGELRRLPHLSTPEAARALGFRSSASLLNPAARCGYPEGLIKRGVGATLAVYMGSEKSARGGRDRRLWVVLKGAAG